MKLGMEFRLLHTAAYGDGGGTGGTRIRTSTGGPFVASSSFFLPLPFFRLQAAAEGRPFSSPPPPLLFSYGHPFYGVWGYRFGRGSFGATSAGYEAAVVALTAFPLSDIKVRA